MAISDELLRIKTAKADIKASIEAKGVTVPSDALIDQYSAYIDEIQTGGGGQTEQDFTDLIEGDIVTLNIPNGTTKIKYSLLNGNTSLASVTIPESVTEIGSSAFYKCTSLATVTIPSGVTAIGDDGFAFCGFASVTCLATTPPTLGSNVFRNTGDCPIYVPADSVAAYKAADRWSFYKDRIKPITE